MKKLLILSCVLFGINSYSQIAQEEKYSEQAEASINDDVYGAFLKEVVKFRVSENHLNEMYYNKVFIEKINSVENNREVCSLSDEEFEKWVSKNIDKTKFTSVEDAVDTFSNYKKFSKLNEEMHKKLNLKLDHYKQIYGLLIDQEFRNNLSRAEINAFNMRFKNS